MTNGSVPPDDPLASALKTFDYSAAIAILGNNLDLAEQIPRSHLFYVLVRVMYNSHEQADALFDRLLQSPWMSELTLAQIENLVIPFQTDPPMEQMARWDQIAARMSRFLDTDHARRVSLEVLQDLQLWEKEMGLSIPNLDAMISEKREEMAAQRFCFGKKRV